MHNGGNATPNVTDIANRFSTWAVNLITSNVISFSSLRGTYNLETTGTMNELNVIVYTYTAVQLVRRAEVHW